VKSENVVPLRGAHSPEELLRNALRYGDELEALVVAAAYKDGGFTWGCSCPNQTLLTWVLFRLNQKVGGYIEEQEEDCER